MTSANIIPAGTEDYDLETLPNGEYVDLLMIFCGGVVYYDGTGDLVGCSQLLIRTPC